MYFFQVGHLNREIGILLKWMPVWRTGKMLAYCTKTFRPSKNPKQTDCAREGGLSQRTVGVKKGRKHECRATKVSWESATLRENLIINVIGFSSGGRRGFSSLLFPVSCLLDCFLTSFPSWNTRSHGVTETIVHIQLPQNENQIHQKAHPLSTITPSYLVITIIIFMQYYRKHDPSFVFQWSIIIIVPSVRFSLVLTLRQLIALTRRGTGAS